MTTKFRQTETPAGITVLESEQVPESSNRRKPDSEIQESVGRLVNAPDGIIGGLRKPDSEIQMLARIERLLAGVSDGAAKRIVAFLADRILWTVEQNQEPK